jgi:hypothetical protein
VHYVALLSGNTRYIHTIRECSFDEILFMTMINDHACIGQNDIWFFCNAEKMEMPMIVNSVMRIRIRIILGSWIRIHIEVESWIRIRIEVKSRIRIRIKVKRWKP